MKKFSILIAGQHSTSISLENEFYIALEEIAREKNISINGLITHIDSERKIMNLSSAIRVYILQYYKEKTNFSKMI